MFQSEWSKEDWQAIERLAKKWGVDLQAKEVVGETATFAGIEAAARRVGDRVARQVCEDLIAQQIELVQEPQPCPTCGTLCQTDESQRPLTTADGQQIDLQEAVCRCSVCDRAFFPSARAAGPASVRL
jgi:tRNA(Ile)-lysidine synthase TilS/MesJ